MVELNCHKTMKKIKMINLILDIPVEVLTGKNGMYWYQYIKGFCNIYLKYYMWFSLLKHLPLHTHTKDELSQKEAKGDESSKTIYPSTGNFQLLYLSQLL